MLMQFKGKRPSMGYRPGDIYDVRTTLTSNMGRCSVILKTPGGRVVPYDSVEALLQNWRVYDPGMD